MRALVLNDTRKGLHPGCMLVMSQLIKGCNALGIEVCRTLQLGHGFRDAFRKEVPSCDVVVINGEGTMHHDAPGAMVLADAGMAARDCGKPVALINTVWQGNLIVNKLLPSVSMVCVRESLSASELCRLGFSATVVPDLAMSCSVDELFSGFKQVDGSIVVLDDVRYDVAMLLARYARSRGMSFYRMDPRPPLYSVAAVLRWGKLLVAGGGWGQFQLDRIRVIKEASVIVTGRFHGACLAILAKRPFVAVSSNTHKIEGLLADAQLGEGAAFVPDYELSQDPFKKIDGAIDQLRHTASSPLALLRYQESCQAYLEKARRDSHLMFQSIAALVKKGA